MTPVPRLPKWAAEAGVQEPKPGEDFDIYWRRIGVPADVLEASHEGLNERSEPLANERVTSWLYTQMPGAVEAYLHSKPRSRSRARRPRSI